MTILNFEKNLKKIFRSMGNFNFESAVQILTFISLSYQLIEKVVKVVKMKNDRKKQK